MSPESDHPQEKSKKIEAVSSDCTNCGSALVFSPEKKAFLCRQCGHISKIDEQSIDLTEQIENDYHKFLEQYEKQSDEIEINVINCSNCGAKTGFDENIVSGDCAFCGMPIVVKEGSLNRMVTPAYILPFSINEDETRLGFKKWIKKQYFAPFDLKRKLQEDESLKCVYIPYYTFDIDLDCVFEVFRQAERPIEEEAKDEIYELKRVDERRMTGKLKTRFDDILVSASNVFDDTFFGFIQPMPLEQMVEFNEKFISGIRTETSQSDISECYRKAFLKADEMVKKEKIGKILNFREVVMSHVSTVNNISFKHILLPIWISAFQYKNKTYKYIVNGATGKVNGQSPVSNLKMTVVIIAGIVGILLALGWPFILFGWWAENYG